MANAEITEHQLTTERHSSFYLASGPEDGPLVIFLHGWPELAISWRHQLPVFGGLGFRAIAPDTTDPATVEPLVAAWSKSGVEGIDVYNYGLMPGTIWNAVGAALKGETWT